MIYDAHAQFDTSADNPGVMVRLIGALSLTVLLAACASSGGTYTPKPFPTPGDAPGASTPSPASPSSPTTPTPRRGSADGYAVSSTALSLRGAPYKPGGVDPSGFDCSGFVRYVFDRNGLAMPRATRDQFQVGKGVNRDRLEPGDLVFFSTVAPGPSHVGIAIGGDQFVHAPSEKGLVRVEQLSATYWASRFVGAKRVK